MQYALVRALLDGSLGGGRHSRIARTPLLRPPEAGGANSRCMQARQTGHCLLVTGERHGGELVLLASRRKWLAILAGCVVATFAGFSMVDGDLVGLFLLGFFGFGTVVALATIVRPTQLHIDSDGVTLVQPWRRIRYEFKDCSEFRMWRGYHTAMVVFDHQSADRDRSLMSILNEQVSGSNSWLPNTFGVSAPELAALLNDRRQRVVDYTSPRRPPVHDP